MRGSELPVYAVSVDDDKLDPVSNQLSVSGLDELSPQDATVKLDDRPEIPPGAVVCFGCNAVITSPSGWSLEVHGVDAAEVERVSLALIQSTAAVTAAGSDVVHGDKYVIAGDAGAVGREATTAIVGGWNNFAANVSKPELIDQLRFLRSRLSVEDIDQASMAGSLANAERAIATGDGPGALAWLRKAGAGALKMAQAVGTELVTVALKRALGLDS